MSALQELRRRWWVLLLGAVVVLLLFATRVATFYTEVLWFDSVNYVHVFWTLLTTRLGVGLIAALLVFALLALNLLIAKRIAPPYRIPSPQEEAIERYREVIEPFARPLLLAISLIIGGLSGVALSTSWDTVLLWLNRVPFGRDDPHFGRDVGYFVFELPFLELLNSWLFTSLLITLALTAVAHYLFGGIRPQSPGQKVAPAVNVHLSILLAAIVGVRAWGFWLDRYLLSYSERGTVTGLSYTDVNAQLLAFQLLAIIAAVCVVLFLLNIRFRSWLLPAGGLGILLVAALVLSGVYPAVIQRLQVDPQELPREREFIDRNLEMTRFAFALDDVETSSFDAGNELEEAQVVENTTTLESLRLWDPATLQTTFQQLQEFRPYYDFRDVDVDRYTVGEEGDEELQQVMISVREISERDLPAQSRTWQNERLFFTHGYGLVASDVSTARGDGQPVFLVNDIPPQGVERLQVDNPRIYFGENPPEYSVVNTAQPELDYPTEAGGQELYDYSGEDGVGTGSFGRRLAFALRYAEPNFVLSDLIEPQSRILFNRNIRQRVEAVAPFLKLDHDPYPVAVDGRIKWIQDAYTATDMVPYSARVDLASLTIADQRQFVTVQDQQTGELTIREETVERPGLTGRANYIRNSVKAVIDAYDGTIELYVVDDEDPLIQAWANVFPDSFTPDEEASEALRAHFRYPEDMFRVQSELYRTYHIPEADEFYTREDAWDIPVDAAFQQNQSAAGQQTTDRSMRPYYLLMRLPGEEEEEFALIQPFNPAARPNLIGWLAARSDGDAYGQLRAYLMPPDRTVFGPQQVQARIDQDGAVAQQITLWNQSGSRVIYGNLLVIPVEDSLLYVQPLFLRAQQSQIPELRKVVLVLGDEVVMEDTLAESLAALFGAVAPGVEGVAGAPDVGVGAPDPEDGDEQVIDPRVSTLIRQALEAFAEAENALREGDLATYAERTREAGRLLEQAQDLSGVDDPIELPEPGGAEDEDDGTAGGTTEGGGDTGGGGIGELEPSPGPEPGQEGVVDQDL